MSQSLEEQATVKQIVKNVMGANALMKAIGFSIPVVLVSAEQRTLLACSFRCPAYGLKIDGIPVQTKEQWDARSNT